MFGASYYETTPVTATPETVETPQWIDCPGCHQATSSTSLFCINEPMTLVAFAPRPWITATVTFMPWLITVLLWAWNSDFLFYTVLSIGAILYVSSAFRQFGRRRGFVTLWAAVSFLLVGLEEAPLSDTIFANLITFTYFAMFGAVIFRRAYSYILGDNGALSVALSSASAVTSFYSLLMELAVLLHRIGVTAVEWLDRIYVAWFFWIWSVRVLLVCGALAVLAVKAADELVRRPVRVASASRTLADHLVAQLYQWADTTFTWLQILRQLIVRTASICFRMTIHFAADDVAPAVLIISAAYFTFSFSHGLTQYIVAKAFSPAFLTLLGTLSIASTFCFEYFHLVSSFDSPSLKWPPFRQAIQPFWKGAATDVKALAFGLSYIIPITSGMLVFVRVVAAHFKVNVPFGGFGYYSAICALIFSGMFVWGYIRRKRNLAS